jgi:hypothetical protein
MKSTRQAKLPMRHKTVTIKEMTYIILHKKCPFCKKPIDISERCRKHYFKILGISDERI